MTDAGDASPKTKLAKLYARKPSGEILEWIPGIGLRTFKAGPLAAPNGIEISSDENMLYVDAWAGRLIWAFDLRTPQKTPRHINVPFMPDNLRWGDDGTLFSAGVFSTPKALMTCVMGTGQRVPCATHWGAVAIDTRAMRIECSIDVDEHSGFGDVSTALKVRGTLWLAAFDGNALGFRALGKPACATRSTPSPNAAIRGKPLQI